MHRLRFRMDLRNEIRLPHKTDMLDGKRHVHHGKTAQGIIHPIKTVLSVYEKLCADGISTVR